MNCLILKMRKLKNSELNRKTISEFKSSKKNPIIIILDNVRSMNNVGSIFRTADAFLIEKIYLCGITATPPHKDIHKTALGSTDSVKWEYCESTTKIVSKLKENEIEIIAIEQTDESEILNDFKPITNKSYGFIFGNEVKGISQDVLDIVDNSIEIPQLGTKHSLNISVSVGIILWDFYSDIKI